MNNKKILLALNAHPALGPKKIAKILARWPDLLEFVQRAKAGSLGSQLQDLVASLDWSQAQQDLDWQQNPEHFIMTLEDANYPDMLRQIDTAPPVLYMQGQLDALKSTILAVVGTRQPSAYGRQVALDWCRFFAEHELVLISGLALGIDTIAHQACVSNEGKTIAVLGSGLDYIYPRQNRHLATKIRQNGLLVSEFSPKTSPNPRHFPRRNRIISGLALSTLIVESTIKSGTMHTAQHAIDQNREVYVVPGRVNDPMSMGCNYLIQQGAILASCAQEVLDGVKNTIYYKYT